MQWAKVNTLKSFWRKPPLHLHPASTIDLFKWYPRPLNAFVLVWNTFCRWINWRKLEAKLLGQTPPHELWQTGVGVSIPTFFFFFFFEGASSVKSYFIFAQNWGKTRANTLILKGRGGSVSWWQLSASTPPLPVEGRGNKERRNTENIEGSNILEVFMTKRQGYRSSYNIKGTELLSALSITRLFNFRLTPW